MQPFGNVEVFYMLYLPLIFSKKSHGIIDEKRIKQVTSKIPVLLRVLCNGMMG
jgi:hypothetical protein